MHLRALLLSFAFLLPAFAADDPKAPAQEKPHRRVRLGGIMIGAGYSHYSGFPYRSYGGPWGYGPAYYYDPFFWPGYIHPGFYNGFGYRADMGRVQISQVDKSALVYLDGALAGTMDKLKDMWLEPGAYRLEVREGHRRLTQKIYVLSGKRLKVTPELMESEAVK